MTHAMPALVVGVTVLITNGLVNAGYGLWWLSQHLFDAQVPAYDWAGVLAVSAAATTVVLIAGLIARRLVAGHGADAPLRDPSRIVALRRDRSW